MQHVMVLGLLWIWCTSVWCVRYVTILQNRETTEKISGFPWSHEPNTPNR